MSINKISPALKRYIPGEVARTIKSRTNSMDVYSDEKIYNEEGLTHGHLLNNNEKNIHQGIEHQHINEAELDQVFTKMLYSMHKNINIRKEINISWENTFRTNSATITLDRIKIPDIYPQDKINGTDASSEMNTKMCKIIFIIKSFLEKENIPR